MIQLKELMSELIYLLKFIHVSTKLYQVIKIFKILVSIACVLMELPSIRFSASIQPILLPPNPNIRDNERAIVNFI